VTGIKRPAASSAARLAVCSTGLRSIPQSLADAPVCAGCESLLRSSSIWSRTECPRTTSFREYPELETEDIRQALQYASAPANEEIGLFKMPAA